MIRMTAVRTWRKTVMLLYFRTRWECLQKQVCVCVVWTSRVICETSFCCLHDNCSQIMSLGYFYIYLYSPFFPFRCHFTILSGRQPWVPRNPDTRKVSEITPTSQLVPFFIYGVHKCLPGDDGHPRTAECKNHWNDGQSQYPDAVRKVCLCGCVSNWTINIAVQLVYSTYL